MLKVFSVLREGFQHRGHREIQEEQSGERQARSPCHYAGNFEFVIEEYQVRVRAGRERSLAHAEADLPRRVRGHHPQS